MTTEQLQRIAAHYFIWDAMGGYGRSRFRRNVVWDNEASMFPIEEIGRLDRQPRRQNTEPCPLVKYDAPFMRIVDGAEAFENSREAPRHVLQSRAAGHFYADLGKLRALVGSGADGPTVRYTIAATNDG